MVAYRKSFKINGNTNSIWQCLLGRIPHLTLKTCQRWWQHQAALTVSKSTESIWRLTPHVYAILLAWGNANPLNSNCWASSGQTSFSTSFFPLWRKCLPLRSMGFLFKIHERKEKCLEFFSFKISVPWPNTVSFIIESLLYRGANHVFWILRDIE